MGSFRRAPGWRRRARPRTELRRFDGERARDEDKGVKRCPGRFSEIGEGRGGNQNPFGIPFLILILTLILIYRGCQRNVRVHTTNPPAIQASSTSAIVACCQLPAGSRLPAELGRKTERRPCASQVSGNNAAMSRSGFGTLVSGTTKTPEMNSRTVSVRLTSGPAADRVF